MELIAPAGVRDCGASAPPAVVELAAAGVGFDLLLLFCTVVAPAVPRPWWFALDFFVTVTDGPGAVLSASNLVAFVSLALLYLPSGMGVVCCWGFTILSVRGDDAIELAEVEVEAGERKPLESSCSFTAPVTTSRGVETISTGVSSVMTDLFAGGGGGFCGMVTELLLVVFSF